MGGGSKDSAQKPANTDKKRDRILEDEDEDFSSFLKSKPGTKDEVPSRLDDDLLGWLSSLEIPSGEPRSTANQKSAEPVTSGLEGGSRQSKAQQPYASELKASSDDPESMRMDLQRRLKTTPRAEDYESRLGSTEHEPSPFDDSFPRSERGLMTALLPYIGAAFFFALVAGGAVFYFLATQPGSDGVAGKDTPPARKIEARATEDGYGARSAQQAAPAWQTSLNKPPAADRPATQAGAVPQPSPVSAEPRGTGRRQEALTEPAPMAALPPISPPSAPRPAPLPEKPQVVSEPAPQRASAEPAVAALSARAPAEHDAETRKADDDAQLGPKFDDQSQTKDEEPRLPMPARAPAITAPQPPERPKVASLEPPVAPQPQSTPALAARPAPIAVAPAAPAPIPAPAVQRPAPPKSTIGARQEADMLARVDETLRMGEVAAARLLLRYLADHGSATGTFRLGQTYDPVFLSSLGVRGLQGDLKTARSWYQKASGLGSQEAAAKLEQQNQ